jgi:hypothetical protein
MCAPKYIVDEVLLHFSGSTVSLFCHLPRFVVLSIISTSAGFLFWVTHRLHTNGMFAVDDAMLPSLLCHVLHVFMKIHCLAYINNEKSVVHWEKWAHARRKINFFLFGSGLIKYVSDALWSTVTILSSPFWRRTCVHRTVSKSSSFLIVWTSLAMASTHISHPTHLPYRSFYWFFSLFPFGRTSSDIH